MGTAGRGLGSVAREVEPAQLGPPPARHVGHRLEARVGRIAQLKARLSVGRAAESYLWWSRKSHSQRESQGCETSDSG